MRSMLLGCACALATMTLGPAALADGLEPQAGSQGPRLIGHGAGLSESERAAYSLRSELCPEVVRVQLTGGTDTEVILLAVIVGLVVVVVIVAVC